MHIEVLVEDISGKRALDELLPKIASGLHTFRVHPYKGIGHIPKRLNRAADPQKRLLLDNLPRLLQGYGRTYPANEQRAVVLLVCDLDNRNAKTFLAELTNILDSCTPKPETYFCLAIEEGEAWFLGDPSAIMAAYPNAKSSVLHSYQNDSICGTWEVLADAVYPGGYKTLVARGWQAVGAEKFKWAENITPHMNVNENASPSFRAFRDRVQIL